MRWIFGVAVIVALFRIALPLPLVAQGGFVSQADRFALYTACAAVNVEVALNEKSHGDLAGLTRESVERAVTSRLRSARIYAAEGLAAVLQVDIHGVATAFHTDLRFHKAVRDDWYPGSTGASRFAITWRRGYTGLHWTNAPFIRGSVAELIDTFIDEYLRVNEAACGKQ